MIRAWSAVARGPIADRPADHSPEQNGSRPGGSRFSRSRFSRSRFRSLGSIRVAALTAWVLAGAVLFTCYLHLSRTAPVDSDGASNVLQAWDMLHGNPMLRGWVLSDVSFYTTELPQYALIELIRELGKCLPERA